MYNRAKTRKGQYMLQGLFDRNNLGVDFGAANTTIVSKTKGLILREPTFVLLDKKTKQTVFTGIKAKKVFSQMGEVYSSVYPLSTANYDFQLLLDTLPFFVKKVFEKDIFARPKLFMSLPFTVTEKEKQLLTDSFYQLGFVEVLFVQKYFFNAVGAGVLLEKANISGVIDIGGGSTTVAVFEKGAVVYNKTIPFGGNTLNQVVLEFLKQKYRLGVQQKTAEELKKIAGCTLNPIADNYLDIKGRDLQDGLPKAITVTVSEVTNVLAMSVQSLAEQLKEETGNLPQEICSALTKNGVVLTGGTALLTGLNIFLQENLNIPVRVAQNPLRSNIAGMNTVLKNIDVYREFFS